jgi:GT2 family glycosyltransferase
MVKLSVAIKSYNHAPYIRRCIESILDQDFEDFEIIVTDDASTDGTPDIVREFSDSRIHLEVLPTNLGISGAMNRTVAKTRGELVAILNSDDFALPGRLFEQVAYLDEHRDVDALFGIPLMVGEDGNPIGEGWPFVSPKDFSRHALLRHFFKNGNFICAPTGMLRRSAYEHVGHYDRRLINLQDFDMWIRFAAAGHNLRVLPSAFSAFRIRAGEANESAPRLDTRIRTELEFAQILQRYLELDAAILGEIFKEDFASNGGEAKSASWRLAQLALNCSQPGHKLFGWRTLYEAAAKADDYKGLREAGSVADIFGFHNQARVSAYVRHLETQRDQDITALAHRVHNLEADLLHKKAELRNVEADLVRKKGELEGRSAELNAILCSSSWRVTQPLRSLVGNQPQGRRMLRRAAKLAWWTATFQLPKRIAVRLRSPLPPLLPVAPVGGGNSASFSIAVDAQAPTELDQKSLFTAAAQAELLEFLRSGERLSFPESGSPDISVVVVVWNQAHLTLRCLRALLAEVGPSIDLVLVDNASSDETRLLLSRLDGVRVLTNKTNDGFSLGCNRGAAASRGRALLLLNNDAFVRPGALAAALATLDSNPEIGAVGGRLVLTSGRLQEAGSIVWSDASTLGYGRGLPEQAGEVMFRRDVDYCSGAFLLTPRVLWNHLGGLDDVYTPAYYEDADYCIRLREAGYRVVYEPAAVVDHYEFGSEAKPRDAIEASLRNGKRFRVRHAIELHRHHLPASESNVLAARECFARERRRLLVISNEVPLGSLGSGYPREKEMLREAAAAGWSVTFFPLHQSEVDWEIARSEIPWEIEIASGRGVPGLAKFLDERRGYYDVVIVSRPDNMAIVRSTLRECPRLLDGTRLIYDAEALFSARDVIKASVQGRPLSPAEIEARTSVEVALADDADAIICVTEAEANIFRARHHIPVHVLSFPTELITAKPGFADRRGFLFIGRLLEQEAPNWQGLAWFVRECWPRIRTSIPDATLSVVGHLHPEHAELEGPGILLLGPVADLQPLYASARVFVAPVQFAAGVPIKILEATAAGLPTAGTRLMARQLRWTEGVEIAAEHEASAFAMAAAELHEDATVWKAMRRASQKRLHDEYSAVVFRDRLRLLLDDCPQLENTAADHRRVGGAMTKEVERAGNRKHRRGISVIAADRAEGESSRIFADGNLCR